MNKTELIDLLESIAEVDTLDTSKRHDHPCSVAVRAINKCFDDIGTLKRQVKRHSSQSKKVQTLIAMSYDPEW